MIKTFLSLARDGGEDAMPIAKSAYAMPVGGMVLPGSTADIPKPKPFLEYGVSGLLRTKGTGYVFDEWLAALQGYQWKKLYREMRDQEPVVGAMAFAVEMILRRAQWRIEPAPGAKGREYQEFIEQCLEDCSHTWEDFIAECTSSLWFGFSLFETVYKRRLGTKGKTSSKHNDGLIGWRKFAPRAQETIQYWSWDDAGGLQAAVQLAAPDYQTVAIPIEKLLLFRTTSLKNNPEGRSVLRNSVKPYMYKRRIEEIQAIGIERYLCGIPVLSLTEEAQAAMGGEAEARKLVTGLRRDEIAGVLLPMAYDANGNPQAKLELLQAAGTQTDGGADTAIQRWNHEILNTMLAGFIEFGQGPNGNRALHASAKGIFYNALAAMMDNIAAVMNRHAIRRLMALNRMDLEFAPKLVPGEVGDRDIDELANYVLKLSQAGIFLADTATANVLRKHGGLPEQSEDEGNPQQPVVPGQQPPSSTPKPGSGQRSNPSEEDNEVSDELEEAA